MVSFKGRGQAFCCVGGAGGRDGCQVLLRRLLMSFCCACLLFRGFEGRDILVVLSFLSLQAAAAAGGASALVRQSTFRHDRSLFVSRGL